eukprot:TRINITY_DN110356_c0_g1_i1.p2 TRINITY_DN110356_c0_g1~~TRINITY_DN110356_c0_g1_i1.p2  ORF type:complete len:129 (-),score=7.36 TRINITY_DN110356_c0_g1_i1:29-415(-)
MVGEAPLEFKDLSLGSQIVLATFTTGIIVITTVQILTLLTQVIVYFWEQLKNKIKTKHGKEQKQKSQKKQAAKEEYYSTVQSSVNLAGGLQHSPLFLNSLQGHLDKVVALSISPDAKRIATCCMDNVL